MINLAMKKKQEEIEKTDGGSCKRKKKKMIADAREEAREILRDARETASEVQKELKELSKLESMGERNKRFDKSRRKLKETEGKYAERLIRQVNNNPVQASEIKVGDRVKVLSLDQNGEILSPARRQGEPFGQGGHHEGQPEPGRSDADQRRHWQEEVFEIIKIRPAL